GFLQFDDTTVYDNVLSIIKDYTDEQLDQWETSLEFTSSRRAYTDSIESENNKNISIEDDVFHAIINSNGMVQIGNAIFKAETDNGDVLTMHSNNMAHLDELTTGQFNPGVMNRFSLNDDKEDFYVFAVVE